MQSVTVLEEELRVPHLDPEGSQKETVFLWATKGDISTLGGA